MQSADRIVASRRAELAPTPAAGESSGGKPFLIKGLGALALAAVFAVSFALPRASFGITVCMFRRIFNVPCPGCGLTRSFVELSHGHVGLAFRMHPLGPFVYAAFAFYLVKWAAEALVRRHLLAGLEQRLREPVLWGFVIAMLVIWICRLAVPQALF